MARIETEVVVVGSGPGGSAVARELAARNRELEEEIADLRRRIQSGEEKP